MHDAVRVSALTRAIESVVRPGHVVLDLGTGTGIVSLLACRAGAARVYAVDEGPILELAREVCRANGFADRVTFVRGLSTRVSLPEKVDVAIADQIGPFGFEGGLHAFARDVQARLLAPTGVFVPARVELWMAPIECAVDYDAIERWGAMPGGFDFAPARRWSSATPRPIDARADQLLAAPAACATIDVIGGENALTLDATFVVERSGELHGIVGWFDAELAGGVTMTNSPLAKERIRRANKLLPVERPIRVVEGDRIHAHVNILQDETMIGWRVTVRSAAGETRAKLSASSFDAELVSRGDVAKLAPTHSPQRTEWADAELEVLALFDGEHAVAAIVDEIATMRPGLFPRRKDAAVFVAEQIKKHAR